MIGDLDATKATPLAATTNVIIDLSRVLEGDRVNGIEWNLRRIGVCENKSAWMHFHVFHKSHPKYEHCTHRFDLLRLIDTRPVANKKRGQTPTTLTVNVVIVDGADAIGQDGHMQGERPGPGDAEVSDDAKREPDQEYHH